MNKNLLLFNLLIILSIKAISQNEKDSLERSFRNIQYSDTQRIKAGHSLAKKFYLPNKPDSAIILLDQILAFTNSKKLRKWSINSYGTKGIAFLYKGNLNEAKTNFEQCIALSKEFKDTAALNRGYGNLASIHYKLGNYQLSLNYYHLVLAYQKKNNMESEVCKTLNNISNVYSDLGLINLTKENLLEVKNIREKLNDTLNLPHTYINLGNVLSDQNKVDSSIYFFKLAENISKKNGQLNLLALVYFNLGEIQAKTKNYEESNKYFKQSLALREELKDEIGIVSSKYGLACNIFENGRTSEAKDLMEPLFATIQEIGDAKLIISIAHNLYECYKAEGNSKKALYYYEVSNKNKEIINKEEQNKTVQQQKMQFEFQLKEQKLIKEQQIRNLQAAKKIDEKITQRNFALLFGFLVIALASLYIFQRNKLRKQKENSLKYLLSDFEMKALRSQINTHFIYNALNGINRFIYEKMPDKAASYLSKFANLLRITVEHTRNSWVEMDQELIAIQLYVELESLNQQEPINFTIEVSPEIDATKTLVPPMLLQPLVENAFKHSAWMNSPSFKLGLFIILENGNLSISIVDNGPSILEKDVLIKNEGLSLATKNIRERLSILNQQEKSASSIALIQENTKFGLSTVSKLIIPYKID